jgi:ribonuclease HI
LCLQEPWIDTLGNPRATSNWRVIYPTIRKPQLPRYHAVTFVNASISTNTYRPLSLPLSDVVVIQFRGNTRETRWTCTVINVYNDLQEQTTLEVLDRFMQTLPRGPNDHTILLGDFNRHHALWELETNTHLTTAQHERFAQPLIDLLAHHNLVMTLPKGIHTLQLKSHSETLTRPDNVFSTSALQDRLISCTVEHAEQGPGADHYPIRTILDITIQRKKKMTRKNFRDTDWKEFGKRLEQELGREDRSWTPGRIQTAVDFDRAVTALTEDLQTTIKAIVPNATVVPHTKRWFTRHVKKKRKAAAKAERESWKYRFAAGHPAHEEFRKQLWEYRVAMEEAKKTCWREWLENASDTDLWRAEKVVTTPYRDGGRTRIPDLTMTDETGAKTTFTTNDEKAECLSGTFFPPPPQPTTEEEEDDYPEPVAGFRKVYQSQIRRAIDRLAPHKAPGMDGIPNIVLKKSIDQIISHLYYIFNAVFELNIFHQSWRDHRTIVLRKPGKNSYEIPNAYRPIALYSTIGKVLTAITAETLTYVTEQFQLLPATHFGGRPARSTSEALQYLMTKIKNAWRAGRVVSVLFLDISGAFPNAVTTQLIRALRRRRVPTPIVDLVRGMLTNRRTKLSFDDYESDWIELNNGIGQGDPLSMILYLYYSADLIEIAKTRSRGATEGAEGWVDDTMIWAEEKTPERGAARLANMVVKTGGALDWSLIHNSKFDVPKSAYMCFTHRRVNIPVLKLRERTLEPKTSHKHLGVILDSKLQWRKQDDAAVEKAMKWTLLFRRLASAFHGIRATHMRHLYRAVAIPKALYAADVWMTPEYNPPGAKKTRGSLRAIRRLESVQRLATIHITGALKSTASDVLNVHANIPPMSVQVRSTCFRAALRFATLPKTHPLHPLVHRAMKQGILRRHNSQIHVLFDIFPELTSDAIEEIPSIGRNPWTKMPFTVRIAETRDKGMEEDEQEGLTIYTDGSGLAGGIGAAAVAYDEGRRIGTLRYHMGKKEEHTVFEAETTGVLLGLQLARKLRRRGQNITIALDNQAVLKAVQSTRSQSGSHIIQEVRRMAGQLRTHICDESTMTLRWVPGHEGIEGNEAVDEEAKIASRGSSSEARDLPKYLKRGSLLPRSKAAIWQRHNEEAKIRWADLWKTSPRYQSISKIDTSLPSKSFMKLTTPLRRAEASIIMQLRTGHVPLNAYLNRIKRSDSPFCKSQHCIGRRETVFHFLLECPQYAKERHKLRQKFGRRASQIPFLLADKEAIKDTVAFIIATRRFEAQLRNTKERQN